MSRVFFGLMLLALSFGVARADDTSWMDQIDVTNVILGAGGEGFCSGTVISSKDRLILTAEHCVTDAYTTETKEVVDPKTGEIKQIEVQKIMDLEVWTRHYQDFKTVSDMHYMVKVIARDVDHDVALLQVVDTGYVPQFVATFAPNSWVLHRGQPIYAVGNPGIVLDTSMTKGIISATQRTLDIGGTGKDKQFFQIDAAIIGGSSGGAIYDDQGGMIGTVTGAVRGTTMAFIVPIKFSKAMLGKAGFIYLDDTTVSPPASTGFAP